jgi:hypothetical protein
MAIAEYTTPDSIRAVLGVSSAELEDDVISNEIYDFQLDEGLIEIADTLSDSYFAKQELDTKTRAEQRFVNQVETWAAYYVASRLLSSVPMFSPRTIKSEKDSFEREADSYKLLRDDITATLDSLRTKILASLAVLFPAEPTEGDAPERVLVEIAAIASDPVLGE